MTQQNNFISLGHRRAEEAIINWAKKEIAAIESSDISADEKQKAIESIKNECDERLESFASPEMLWGT